MELDPCAWNERLLGVRLQRLFLQSGSEWVAVYSQWTGWLDVKTDPYLQPYHRWCPLGRLGEVLVSRFLL